ncbi:MAG: DUF4350 domain-containing protein [Polyangiales bacterium]
MLPTARAAAVTLSLLAAPATAWSVTDYDPQNRGWNGCSELVRAAAEADIELQPVRVLDWDRIQRGQAILVLYPTESLGVADVSAFVEEGGRVAWFDDFGSSRALLDWLQFRRAPVAHGTPHDPTMRELLLAYPRAAHPLTEGVEALVTNIPVAYSHPRLTPIVDFGDPSQGLVLVGQVGRGKLVVGGDPSLFINTMQQFPGNRRFARNLLEFLSAGPSPRVTLVFTDTRARGAWRGRGRAHTRQREAVNTLNDSLRTLGEVMSSASVMRPFAALLAAAATAALALLTWGRRPSERYGPRGPVGAVAGVTERVAIFGAKRANLLFPALYARRHLERGLLRAAGLRPPTAVRSVLARLRGRLDDDARRDLVAVLDELDALGQEAEARKGLRVEAARFLSLWRRIGVILQQLEKTR